MRWRHHWIPQTASRWWHPFISLQVFHFIRSRRRNWLAAPCCKINIRINHVTWPSLSRNPRTLIKSLHFLWRSGTRRFHIMTSSNGDIFRVTGHLCGEFTGPGEFPTQRPVTRSFDVFFDMRLNKQLSKQWWGWWFATLLRPLWRHRNDLTVESVLKMSSIGLQSRALG